jgi:ubiquitin-protein ligase E3 A/E3 ubiquitin-protein ligase HERC4
MPQNDDNKSPFGVNWAHWDGPGEPMTLADDIMVIHATCGGDHTVLVTQTGQLLVGGNNQHGQLGLDPTSHETVAPVQALSHPSGKKFVSAEAGTLHTLLLDDQGDVWSMGNGKAFLEPVLTGKSIRTIATGGSQNVAIASQKEAPVETTKLTTTTTPGLEGLLNGILLEEEAAGSAAHKLVGQTEELFKCPAVMNSLFLDPKGMDDLYHKLISAGDGNTKVRQQVVSAVETGMMQGLETIRTARLMYPESVRCLLLYLQCPLFWLEENEIYFDARGELILSLCETILGLSFEGYKAFLAWSTSVYARDFVPFLVKPLVMQLNRRLEKDRTRAVPVIVGVLRWFQNVSERSEEIIARPEDFHSKGIGELPMEALFDDLRRFKAASKSERSANFFICGNPFLLSPGAKRNLLQVENQVKMVQAAQGGVQFDAARRQYLFQPYFVLAIDRKYLLQQTLQAVSSASPGELQKSLKIVFKGEDGVDAGGVIKEFFQLLVAQLFDVNTGMWSMNFGDGTSAWFNSDCIWNYDGYYLVGVLVGLAVYNSVLLDVHFPHTVYRKLLGLPLGLEDMADEEVMSGLQSLLDYEGDDVEDIFCLLFEVTWMDLGAERRRELKPGGANIPVTNNNKEEYVMLYVKWLLVDSIQSQYDEFERGFVQVMEDSSLDLLRPEELELLVVGTPELDFAALEENTQYEGYDKDSAVVKSLWRFVKNSPRDTQLNFLKFSTGSTKAPIGGLGELSFKIQRAGPDSIQLPTSHTCFNTLLVPDYGDNYEKLAERVGRAVLECEGFGLQ